MKDGLAHYCRACHSAANKKTNWDGKLKTCTKCNVEKSTDEFYHQSLQEAKKMPWCKPCKDSYTKEYVSLNKERCAAANTRRRNERKAQLQSRIDGYKLALGCKTCGYAGCPSALEAHHPHDDKEYTISYLVKSGFAWDTVLTELAKCEIICANCHRELHAGWSAS